MKHILFTLLALSFVSAFSQNHFCADVKIKQQSAARSSVISAHQDFLESKYDVKNVHLNLHVERTSLFIEGDVTSQALSVDALDTFVCELHSNLVIDSILFNGQLNSFSRNAFAVIVPLTSPLSSGSLFTVQVFYHGTPPSSGGFSDGFSNATSPSWGNIVTWSLSQPFAAHEWWPCKQSLRDKIDSSSVFITTDSTNKAGSNGILQRVVSLGNGLARYEWVNNHVIDYYLISVAVAKYIDYRTYAHPQGYADSILIQNYIYDNPQTLIRFKGVVDSTSLMVELFSKLYGLYPFADQKYGHCMAPLGGGMEHQTMTTQGFFDFDVTAHELGHQWFGDHVTCATWNDIFMNEGFASYSEYLCNEFLKSKAIAQANMLNVHSNVMSSSGGSVWFNDSTNNNRIFDSRLSYDKGSAIIHSLRFEMNNDSLFFQILKTYQQQFANSTATILDFKSLAETVSGKNLTIFFNQWIFGQGYPTFGIKWKQLNGLLFMRVAETVSMPSYTPLFKTDVEYKIVRTGLSDTIVRLYQDAFVDTFSFPLEGTVSSISIDPQNWILNKAGSITNDLDVGNVGISTIENKFRFYPNPTGNQLNLELDETNFSIEIYNSFGAKILEAQNKKQLSVTDLAAGFYTLKVCTKDNFYNHSFIKQ